MLTSCKRLLYATVLTALFLTSAIHVFGQSGGSSTSISGTVLDPSQAVVANAEVEIHNPVSGFRRSARTDSSGNFSFPNVPFNPYHLTVLKEGFSPYAQDVEVRSGVPLEVKINLKLLGASESVTVMEQGSDLVEKDPSFHTDVDRGLFDKVPLESQSSSLSSLVTLTTPGVVADSNGLFHGLGDHADNSFSYDGQPITDQQSKVFSNQIPSESIQSMEVVFRWCSRGNFIAGSGLNTSRFLDPPEFEVIHSKGNLEDIFDRVDYQISNADSLHLNFDYSRSWFQTPNSFDQLNIGVSNPVTGTPLGPTDQRSLIKTYNVAPVWTRLISPTTLFTFGAFVRHDQYNYYPSADVFADGTGLIPGGESATVSQNRKLTNAGLCSDVSYVKGIHSLKVGVVFEHTFLTEQFNFGLTDPVFTAVCLNAGGNPDPSPSPTNPALCPFGANPGFLPILLPFDLTRSGTEFPFRGHADIRQLALYAQDQITKGNWAFNLGFREDVYRGIVHDTQPGPRLGVAYKIKQTNTVARLA